MIKVITEIEDDKWNDLVNKSAVASYFQTPACYRFYKTLSFLEPFVYGITDNDKLLGVVQGYIIADGGKIKHFLSRRAIIPGGALLSNECPKEATKALLKYVIRDLKSKAIYIEIRNYNDYSYFKPEFIESGFKYEEHLNFHVKTLDLESSLKQLSSTKRRDVKISKKEGAEVVMATNEDEIKEYYDLLFGLYKSKVKTPLFPYEFFKNLFYQEEGKFFLVKYAGRILGGSVCTELIGRTLYEWFVCGLDREIKNVYPSTLATWGAIEYASTHNMTKFDMMGAGKPNDGYGVREFKAKFGGELLEQGRYIHICKPIMYETGKIGVKILKKLK
ncbi:MAG: GNAT family N-acetyltransferase [Bacteroidia bacterium]|nr:GNAT family N-acetyltransferase [Bacteroidia bacterium]